MASTLSLFGLSLFLDSWLSAGGQIRYERKKERRKGMERGRKSPEKQQSKASFGYFGARFRHFFPFALLNVLYLPFKKAT